MDIETDLQLTNQTNVELREEIIRLENENIIIKRMVALSFGQLSARIKKEGDENERQWNNL